MEYSDPIRNVNSALCEYTQQPTMSTLQLPLFSFQGFWQLQDEPKVSHGLGWTWTPLWSSQY